MSHRIVVAVDGPAGSGKSSVSKEVAIRLGLTYIDSGAHSRAVTWFFLEKYGNVGPSTQFEKDLNEIRMDQQFQPGGTSVTRVNGADVSVLIRDERIARHIGIVSDAVPVRNFINARLRAWSAESSIIMDGRDIGTVVFPDADVKIYLDASVEVRAGRRIEEYRELGKTLDENSIKNLIIQRDSQDKSRPFGTLVQARDAVYLDTSGLSKDEVIDEMVRIILQKTDT
jgi:cytidylate kinase